MVLQLCCSLQYWYIHFAVTCNSSGISGVMLDTPGESRQQGHQSVSSSVRVQSPSPPLPYHPLPLEVGPLNPARGPGGAL